MFFHLTSTVLGKDPFTKSELKKIYKAACSSYFNCGVKISFDKHSNRITIIQKKPLTFTGGSMSFGFFLTKNGNKLIKRRFLKVIYRGSNWRFLKRLDITLGFLKDGDENKIQNLSIDLSNVNRVVHSGGNVTETAYVNVNKEIDAFFRERFKDERFLSLKIVGEDTYSTAGLFGKSPRKRSQPVFELYDNEYNEDFLTM